LLNAGADINAPPAWDCGVTVIQAAANTGDVRLVEELISLGAELNDPPGPIGGRTCLQLAAKRGDANMIQALLKFGAQVNAPGAIDSGKTALQAAFESGHSATFENLLAADADDNAKVSVLPAAIRRRDIKMVLRLLNEIDLNRETNLELSVIAAAEVGAVEVVRLLLDSGARVSSTSNDSGRTALHAAVEFEHTAIVCALLDAKADINCACMSHEFWGEDDEERLIRPLAMAVYNRSLEMIQLLLSRGANVNASTDSEITALGAALSYDEIDWETVRILVAAGADVNKATKWGGLPLCIAVEQRRMDLVDLFLEAGANINGSDVKGYTALTKSIERQDLDIMQALLRAGANTDFLAAERWSRTALQTAAKIGNVRAVNLLLQYGADCNVPAAEICGFTALQAAAINGNLRICVILLEAGADINAPAAKEHGRTALEGAAEHGRLDIVSLLLKNETDTEGLERRCEEAATFAEKNGHVVIANLLREYRVS
jgi:ankyrin repeat protein